jgi:hypothetical protein
LPEKHYDPGTGPPIDLTVGKKKFLPEPIAKGIDDMIKESGFIF